jgi:L-ascorbate metabolism protein UlaG (beta-lactamase superfamily)
MNTITWLGHAAFVLQTPQHTIAIDPWLTNPSAPQHHSVRPDIVLVTHDHADHVGQALEICRTTGAKLGAIVELAGKLMAQGLPQEQVINGIGFNMGGTVHVDGIGITMTQAFHSCEVGHPVGFIIRLEDGFTVYHAGDTTVFSSMALWGKLYSIDLALLPIGGVFTMDPAQAALATLMLRAKKVCPMHWGSFPVLEQNTKRFHEELSRLGLADTLWELPIGQPQELPAKTS